MGCLRFVSQPATSSSDGILSALKLRFCQAHDTSRTLVAIPQGGTDKWSYPHRQYLSATLFFEVCLLPRSRRFRPWRSGVPIRMAQSFLHKGNQATLFTA